MAPLEVHIKHAGKVYDLNLDPDLPPSVFKETIYQLTGVPVERMKVMVKGGVLKDDSVWKKVAPKAGQTFMVIGAAGELPKAPEKPIVFLEDMDDSELAEALAKPVGLKNLGNTCYMNATVQALRAIPELQQSLIASSASQSPLPRALRDLYSTMSRTTDHVVPMAFLQVLRQVNPQFGEIDRSKGNGMAGYAQQDAEECYAQIINSLRDVPLAPPSSPLQISGSTDEASTSSADTPVSSGSALPVVTSANVSGKKFIESYLMGEMRRELTCDESPTESPSITTEQVLKIECNISITTNFMLTGIMNSLDQKVEKNSPSLGRQAIYSQKSRMTRLPSYLTVHMVRFAWRQDIGKKTKIMRKVKFPTELDALDLVTDGLKEKLLPVSRKLKEVEKERAERRKVRKRTKAAGGSTVPAVTNGSTSADVEMGDASATTTAAAGQAMDVVVDGQKDVKEGGELEDESVYRSKEVKELDALVDPTLKNDIGCSVSGLYDLVAIVTHKGAAADAGHYMGFVKKSVFHSSGQNVSSGGSFAFDDDDEDWYKFDDEKVSLFPKEKLTTLDGGGEDSSAYVLLYRTKSMQ